MPKTKILLSEAVSRLDRLPSRDFLRLEHIAAGVAGFYGFEEMKPAVIDDPRACAPLVKAGFLDDRALVVAKTRNGEEFMLVPSMLFGALRCCAHRVQELSYPVKWYMAGDKFFWEETAERGAPRDRTVMAEPEWTLTMMGEENPVGEAEIIQVIWKILQEADLGALGYKIELRINAIGCEQCRGSFRSALGNYLRARKNRLCPKSRRDVKKMSVRVLSCPDEKCRIVAQLAPQTLDFLCEACKSHTKELLEFMDEAEIPYMLDPQFFREGSWFRTILFEFVARRPVMFQKRPGASGDAPVSASASGMPDAAAEDSMQIAVSYLRLAEGGRVSLAATLIAGKPMHAVSGALFMRPLETLLHERRGDPALKIVEEVFLVQLGDLAKRKSFAVMEALREAGIGLKESLGRDSIKSQLKIAERIGTKFALIIGQKEALDETIMVREVESGIQETIPQVKLVEFLKRKLKRKDM